VPAAAATAPAIHARPQLKHASVEDERRRQVLVLEKDLSKLTARVQPIAPTWRKSRSMIPIASSISSNTTASGRSITSSPAATA
jgi:hypothetical protein